MDNEDPADPSPHQPRVTGSPEAVWLVYGDLEDDATHAECADSGEVTWCEDAQFPADVRYLRADLLYHEARQIAAEAVAAERERWLTPVLAMLAAHDASMVRVGKMMQESGVYSIRLPGEAQAELDSIAALRGLVGLNPRQA